KLTKTECGGDYATTSGIVLLDRALKPQPDPGEAYSARVAGQGRPTSYGNQILCIYLMDDYKQFDTDTDRTVDVSRACTSTAAAYDRDLRAHRRAAAARDRRRARKACGKGVAL